MVRHFFQFQNIVINLLLENCSVNIDFRLYNFPMMSTLMCQ